MYQNAKSNEQQTIWTAKSFRIRSPIFGIQRKKIVSKVKANTDIKALSRQTEISGNFFVFCYHGKCLHLTFRLTNCDNPKWFLLLFVHFLIYSQDEFLFRSFSHIKQLYFYFYGNWYENYENNIENKWTLFGAIAIEKSQKTKKQNDASKPIWWFLYTLFSLLLNVLL